jgi:hypothetical protein
MDRRLKLLLFVGFLLVLAVTGLAFYYRLSAPPSSALLLPEGNMVVYADLRPLHLLDSGRDARPPEVLDPGYRAFLEQTGFNFERDLDEAAISQKYPGADPDSESSALFTGRFDIERLNAWLQKSASATENYADTRIFSIPHEGHTVRVCLLDRRSVAVTNMASAEPIHGIIDKFRNPRLAGPGPYLLQNYYRHVPAVSLAWVIYRPAQASQSGTPQAVLPGGLGFGLPGNTTSVLSLRYSGSVALKAEIFSASEAAASDLADSAATFLSVYRGASEGHKGTDANLNAAIDSIQIQHDGSRTVLTATLTKELVKKIWQEAGRP